ncbi:MAG TPA: hypothetical protein VNB90_00650 [Cytophagaceae bacterium]|nr:hypothetical protein [Cytophagaceae bacterium]
MDNKVNKLDQLFREKLQHHELAPEEDYWPYLEQELSKPSFYKFGWKHINIYNTSLAVLLLLIPLFYFLSKPEEKKQTPPTPTVDSISTGAPEKIISPSSSFSSPTEVKKKTQKKITVEKTFAEQEIIVQDSTPAEIPVEKIIAPEPAPIQVEEKPKPRQKKIIYVVQQDTIVEKDTVKVRRKRKN